MKSPILNKFESKLVEVNDQLCYFLFSDVELKLLLAKTSSEDSTQFTTDIFPYNKFSKRLHIQVNTLPSFRERAFNTLMGVSIIAAVEYMLYYIEEIERFRAKVSPSAHDSLRDDKPEEQLNMKLSMWLGYSPDIALIKTIKYLRLRRNHIAHQREELSQDFSSFIKNHSHSLNNYWGAKKTEIYNFDFSNSNFSVFSENDALALVNLTRVCLKIIDKDFISTINHSKIVEFEMKEFKKNKAVNSLTTTKKVKKFRNFLKSKYGTLIGCSENEYESYANKD